MNSPLARPSTWKVALLFALVLLAMAFSLSGPARARALHWVRSIAGFTVEERPESPLKGLAEGESAPARPDDQPSGAASTGAVLATSAPASVASAPTSTAAAAPQPPVVATVPADSLPAALANPPFSFGLPAWLPDGFTIDEQAAIANSQDWLSLSWRNTNGSEILMLVEREYTGYNLPVGEGSTREVQVNGQPALLIMGAWDSQHQWDSQRGITLHWSLDGRSYRLVYSEREPLHNELRPIAGDLEQLSQTLIRMAESIP